MPDGVVQWFDEASGEAAVVKGSKVIRAAAREVDLEARRAGARVHFDLERRDGVERAVRVRLRDGTRPARGTLAGARRADAKGGAPFARPHPERGPHLAQRPAEVARAWAASLAAKSIDEALALYAPDAVVHEDGYERRGRRHLHAYLEASPLLGATGDPSVRGEGDGDVVVLRWDPPVVPRTIEVRCRVAHGLLAEQWAPELVAGPEPAAPPVPEPLVVTRGPVAEADREYARRRLAGVLARTGPPTHPVTVKLTHEPDPARHRPHRAQVTLDLRGEPVRAEALGTTMTEAIDLLRARVKDQLEHRAGR